jgi:hypothetical protein
MARTGLADVSIAPLKFRTAGFPQYGFMAGISDEAFPAVWFAIVPLCSLGPSLFPVLCPGRCAFNHLRASGGAALPQGPSLRSGFCCPSPSSLNRPHPPHSRAYLDFTVLRLIPDALAVPIRIGLATAKKQRWLMPASLVGVSESRSLPVYSKSPKSKRIAAVRTVRPTPTLRCGFTALAIKYSG